MEHDWTKLVEFLKRSSVVAVASTMGAAALMSFVSKFISHTTSAMRIARKRPNAKITISLESAREEDKDKIFTIFRDYIGNVGSSSSSSESSSGSTERAR